MGSLISSRRMYQSSSRSDHRRNRHSKLQDPYRKRSTMDRPVLRLHVKPESMSRRRVALSNGVCSNSERYEHVVPRKVHTSPVTHSEKLDSARSRCPPRPRSLSADELDRMIILQYVENNEKERDSEEDPDYDHLESRDDHLVRLSYARMSDVQREEDHFGNITIYRSGALPQIRPSTSLGMINMCQRIQEHTPQHSLTGEAEALAAGHDGDSGYGCNELTSEHLMDRQSKMKKSYSTDSLCQFYTGYNLDHWRKSQSMHAQHVGGKIDWDQIGGGMDWSFGENIMRAVSQHGVTLFNIDNPTHESELEVNKAWPQLKDKMRVWRSLNNMDMIDSSETSDVLIFHNSHHRHPHSSSFTITAH